MFVGGDANKGKFLIINELPLLASPPMICFWKADSYITYPLLKDRKFW